MYEVKTNYEVNMTNKSQSNAKSKQMLKWLNLAWKVSTSIIMELKLMHLNQHNN